jgi:hypothetical protein
VLRKDLESTDTMRAINFEVVAIDGKNAAQTLTLGDADQCRIRKIHRQVAILPHQLAHTRAIFDAEVGEYQSVGIEHAPQ